MLNTLVCLGIVAVTVAMLFRRVEARLALLGATVALFALAGKLPDMVEKMATELTKPGTVIPICASMGFAYVLRATECDQHLVRLLLRPLDHPVARVLLIPGCILAGYVVNMAIVSQSGALAVVGSIAVPLLLRKGVSRATTGSLLLLGTSMGGELFNPGAVETVTLADLTKISTVTLAQRSMPLNALACGAALLVYWRLAVLWEQREKRVARAEMGLEGRISDANAGEQDHVKRQADGDDGLIREADDADDLPFRVHPGKAVVPFVPLLLLFGSAHLPFLRPFHDHVAILAAMLLGCVAAACAAPAQTGKLAAAFFEGMGFAYFHVISITVCATLFAEGIKTNGLIQRLVGGLAGRPGPALLASLILPWGLAALSGSGAGAASSMMRALIPGAAAMRLDPAQTGFLIAMGSHFGRTMSPAAAVAVLCATLVSLPGANSREIGTMTLLLTRRVAPALLAGGAVLYLAALLGVGLSS